MPASRNGLLASPLDDQQGGGLLGSANPLTQGVPTWADAYSYNAPLVRQNFADAWTAAQDPNFWTGAAQQYGNALLMGTTAPGRMPIYRGQMRGKEPSGNFFSEDREFAKQFTRQGLDEEVITRHIDPSAIYHPPKSVYAGDEAAVDEAIAAAKREGKSAVRLSEAKGSAPGEKEPASIFVFDKSGLSRQP